jgi:hypothetical protein
VGLLELGMMIINQGMGHRVVKDGPFLSQPLVQDRVLCAPAQVWMNDGQLEREKS